MNNRKLQFIQGFYPDEEFKDYLTIYLQFVGVKDCGMLSVSSKSHKVTGFVTHGGGVWMHPILRELNPSYASLTVTQRASWVRPPTSYKEGAVSSLSVAFEDQDGNKLKALPADRYLYIYGNRASVKKWKYRQPINKDKAPRKTAKHIQC